MDCRYFEARHCRSCELLDKSYDATLLLKEEKLKHLFSGVNLNLQTTIGVSQAQNSRNKAKFAVNLVQDNIQFGFYDSSMNFHELENCPLHMEGLNDLLPVLKESLQKFKIIPYSLPEKKGELKYVIVSKSEDTQEVLVRFVLRSKESLDRLKKMAQELSDQYPMIKVVTANLQPEHKAVMEGVEEIVLTSESLIKHTFGDVHLTLGPRSFFQVTPEIAGKLYECAGNAVANYKVKSFLDLYCGVGAFSYFAARHCPDVMGVEISPEAINCANASRELNSVSGIIEFQALDVDLFLKNLDRNFEAILVNPPRRGLNERIIENIVLQAPKLFIYSSCNAETLARDYQLIADQYQILETRIFDMFPFTEHFETLIVFSRREV